METSTLLPTPSSRDWRGASKTKPRDTVDSLIETGATKRRLGLLTFSPVALPVKPPPKQAEDEARQTTAGSGRRLLPLYERSNRHGASLRTCTACLLSNEAWYSRNCALRWKSLVTTSNRLLFRLLPSTRHIDGTVSGLLRTPVSQESGTAAGRLMARDGQPLRIGQTAYDQQTGRRVQIGLQQQLQLLATLPTAFPTGHATGARWRLQPAFVSWMMGFPEGWCDFPMERASAKPGGAKRPSKPSAMP